MKGRIAVLSSMTVVAIVLFTFTVYNSSLVMASIPPPLPATDVIGKASDTQKWPTSCYVVEHNGFLSVFADSGKDTLLRTLDIPVRSLSKNDKEIFEDGIWVTEEELAMLIEDFTS